jgi:KUP system potassium uptake protein
VRSDAAKAAKPQAETPSGLRKVPGGRYLLVLCLGALGVVYGDIGTSPLYAIRECFSGSHPVAVNQPNVLGILSLIFWSLVLVISIKYLALVMRADNRGEGGIMALLSLIRPKTELRSPGRWMLIAMGLFGASLLYGDGMITPAISVLSAVEGLRVATPFFDPYIVPITIVILMWLFSVQRRGTAGIGAMFGPVTLLWFVVLAVLGVWHISQNASVLWAINPVHAVRFFVLNRWLGFLTLGVVFLVITGAEALYADMGHFGRRPIRITWFVVVLPSLLLNYFGQGALLLLDPTAAENPFYRMVPRWALFPMVVLATAATVIASQAVISGTFSLTRQAIQLGYLPRLEIDHTSAREIGQIYIPAINWALMMACIGLVVGFRESSNLAAAYGLAVTTDMVFTTILFAAVTRIRWGWRMAGSLMLAIAFLAIDLPFWGANLPKIPHGGWFPLLMAFITFLVMTTWTTGRRILNDRLEEGMIEDQLFLRSLEQNPPVRVPGTAVFMDRTPERTPHALLHNIKHNKILHQRVILLTVVTLEVPHTTDAERLQVRPVGHNIFRVLVRYGFMEDPDIPAVLQRLPEFGVPFSPADTTYFLGRETLIPSRRRALVLWRYKLFAWMLRNATSASFYFRLPPNRVVELGAQIEV